MTMAVGFEQCKICETKENIYSYKIYNASTDELQHLRCPTLVLCDTCIEIARKNHPEYRYEKDERQDTLIYEKLRDMLQHRSYNCDLNYGKLIVMNWDKGHITDSESKILLKLLYYMKKD